MALSEQDKLIIYRHIMQIPSFAVARGFNNETIYQFDSSQQNWCLARTTRRTWALWVFIIDYSHWSGPQSNTYLYTGHGYWARRCVAKLQSIGYTDGHMKHISLITRWCFISKCCLYVFFFKIRYQVNSITHLIGSTFEVHNMSSWN